MTATKRTCFSIPAQDKVGVLSQILTNLREENIDLDGLWGWGTPDGKAQILVVPKEPAKFRSSKSNQGSVEGICFKVMESDQVGSILSVVERVSKAGINIQAIDAVSVDGKVGAYIWCVAQDVAKLEGVL